jgi:hypothetical protein
VARTAVIAGTATAVSHGVNRRMSRREQQRYEAEQYEAQQATAYAPAQAAAPAAPPAAAQSDMVSELKELSQLHNAGVLSDSEFEAAKQKLLAQ